MLLSDYVKRIDANAVAANPAERRMTSRLFEYWNTLRKGQLFPSRSKFSVEAITGLADYGFAIILDKHGQGARFQFLGSQLKPLMKGNLNLAAAANAADDSLISLIAKHHAKVMALKAPVAFESDFKGRRGRTYLFRAVMCPFSEDGNTIDCIVGAVTHKEKLSQPTPRVAPSVAGAPPQTAPNRLISDLEKKAQPASTSKEATDGPADIEEPSSGQENDLSTPAQRLERGLGECQKLAASFQASHRKSRAALYDTLERAYRFHFETQDDSDAFAALCATSDIKLQKRAPFTGLIKLIFGKDHDKSRISEYAACLACADRDSTPPELFRPLLDSTEGGIKALVKAERAARQGRQKSVDENLDLAKAALRDLAVLAEVPIRSGTSDEFALVLARRSKEAKGTLSAIAVLNEKPTVVNPILKRAATRIKATKKT